MTQLKRNVLLIISMLLVVLIFASCGSSGEEGESDKVDLTFTSSNNTHGTSLDPGIEYNGARNVEIGVGETLFKLNDDTLDVENHLASDYEHVDDLTWEITIREGINFSNGKPLTAEAVKESFEYTLDALTRIATMLDVDTIEADGNLLTITTNDIVATLPRILTDVSMFVFDTEGTDDYGEGVVGTGPYIHESIDDDGNSELVKNADYWQGEPGADRVSTKFIADTTAIAQAMQSGELDYATISGSDIELFEDDEDYEILEYDNGRVYFLYLNPEYTFTEDPVLREALTYAFDRESYLDGVYDGRGNLTTTIFPLWSGYSTEDISQVEYNQEKAKSILKEAGYEDIDGDGFLEKDGEKLHLNITSYPNNGFPILSQALQASLKEIGIDSDIVISDSIVDDLDKGKFNIATYGYTTLTMGDTFNFLEPVFQTEASSNFNHFSNSEVDAYLEELRATSDTEERKQIVIDMQEHIYEQNEHVFLMHLNTYKVIKKGVKNVTTGFGDKFNLWKVTK